MRNPIGAITILFFSVLLVFYHPVAAQDTDVEVLPSESRFKNPKSRLWVNTYGNIRISKRLFWVAQTHFRFEETDATPFAGQVGQIYNRHAIGYIYNKKINAALGGVMRINFNTDESSTDRNVVPEFRIWHQYQFAMPVYSAMIYHRIRIEHRWTQGFEENSDYIFRNRWRYMFRAKIPLNNDKLAPKTLYISPETELIMQSGKAVVGSVMEDLRLTTTLGYILTPRLTVAAGAMYSQGQTLENAGEFKQNWTLRFHVYFSPDFRKVKNKLPSIHLND
ncbi:DUF2490 domain-containing protein [Costertonia aggregata]|uniref:DUF2490 domain-containing protein n=1 Tax=Costertonia aggregata TaxID=343403 RepID=A0A7H9AU05_9FLAO|nr:DUF2490 domain-containing protein [Costertonia aggregata]QLG46929.1 DUF2490 domain-containing protein [Costertonia aggregata]